MRQAWQRANITLYNASAMAVGRLSQKEPNARVLYLTHAEAEEKAQELNPEGRPNVRRVRYTDQGQPGEFRKEDNI